MKNYLRWGTHNSVCDVCGFKYKADQLRTRWDGLEVCEFDYETRHPQSLIRINAERTPSGPIRSEPEDLFLENYFCPLEEIPPLADSGTADCARVGFPVI